MAARCALSAAASAASAYCVQQGWATARFKNTALVSHLAAPLPAAAAVVLIGDAAHGVTPATGNGMNSAMEDGVLLGQARFACFARCACGSPSLAAIVPPRHDPAPKSCACPAPRCAACATPCVLRCRSTTPTAATWARCRLISRACGWPTPTPSTPSTGPLPAGAGVCSLPTLCVYHCVQPCGTWHGHALQRIVHGKQLTLCCAL